MLLLTSAGPTSLKLLVMWRETPTCTTRQLGAAHGRADHTVISPEWAHTSYPSLYVCVWRGDRGEEHALPGQKPTARCWKPDTSLVFRPQVIAGKMRRTLSLQSCTQEILEETVCGFNYSNSLDNYQVHQATKDQCCSKDRNLSNIPVISCIYQVFTTAQQVLGQQFHRGVTTPCTAQGVRLASITAKKLSTSILMGLWHSWVYRSTLGDYRYCGQGGTFRAMDLTDLLISIGRASFWELPVKRQMNQRELQMGSQALSGKQSTVWADLVPQTSIPSGVPSCSACPSPYTSADHHTRGQEQKLW
uniref:uncharacterized protein LOC129509079 isoform X2 n=1 Tax=Nyctereutes procyonoides TaxID=34880 RepID=UPI002445361F|nr:uncharacterized protein LOC129509079 isoform X2 [Nyctereutes procyonoides]